MEHSCPLIALFSGCRNSAQAALDAQIMRPEEVRAAVRESADLGQWLGNKVHKLFSTPVEIVAFSDEEGVRWATFLHSPIRLCQANHPAWVAAHPSRRAMQVCAQLSNGWATETSNSQALPWRTSPSAMTRASCEPLKTWAYILCSAGT